MPPGVLAQVVLGISAHPHQSQQMDPLISTVEGGRCRNHLEGKHTAAGLASGNRTGTSHGKRLYCPLCSGTDCEWLVRAACCQ
ncbi:unnamed protein product, partial [Nesidiocoris tenuis]